MNLSDTDSEATAPLRNMVARAGGIARTHGGGGDRGEADDGVGGEGGGGCGDRCGDSLPVRVLQCLLLSSIRHPLLVVDGHRHCSGCAFLHAALLARRRRRRHNACGGGGGLT